MTTDISKTPAPNLETRPEHSLSFAKPRRGDSIWNLWASPTSSEWGLTEIEGQVRAITVLGLEVEGETPSDKAAELGRIFARIARDQFARRRNFVEIEAIVHFWALVGELAAAYATPQALGYAAKVVCRRAASHMAWKTEREANYAAHRRRERSKAAKRKKRRSH